MVVDSYTKWPEISKCGRPTYTEAVKFLHKIFVRFTVPGMIISDKGMQFTESEFRIFCKSLAIEPITTPLYHLRSNREVEHFGDVFKSAVKKVGGRGGR